MIPDDAVTAAAKELWDVNEHDDCWVDDFPSYNAFLRHKALMILEAAAPHLMAEAWDECVASDTAWVNPYRKATNAD